MSAWDPMTVVRYVTILKVDTIAIVKKDIIYPVMITRLVKVVNN